MATSWMEHDSVGYSARCRVVLGDAGVPAVFQDTVPTASWAWNISTFANRTTTSSSSSFSLILGLLSDHLLWRGPTNEGGTGVTAV